ncbi:MAG: sulfur transferase domain-containing protein [Caulobacterales bacterium]
MTDRFKDPRDRRRAEQELLWKDYGFLRAAFPNFHWVVPGELARANQPSPRRVAHYAQMGFKTIINLRGATDTGFYWLEHDACARHGITLIDAPLDSRDAPSLARLERLAEIFRTMEKPALMHCKSGADRAGFAGALYLHLQKGAPISEALKQLSLRYLHVKQGKTGMLDFFFETYAAETGEQIPLMEWARTSYEPAKLKAAFMSQWWANVLVENVLKRE